MGHAEALVLLPGLTKESSDRLSPKPTAGGIPLGIDPYLRYLREDLKRTEETIRNVRNLLCRFLDGLGERATSRADEGASGGVHRGYITQYLKDSPDNLRRMAGTLRGFLRFCARQGYITSDLSVLIPSVPSYRLASLPKGMEDSALERILNVIPKGNGRRREGFRHYVVDDGLRHPGQERGGAAPGGYRLATLDHSDSRPKGW